MKDFDLACLELKQKGKGYVKNYKEINDEGKLSNKLSKAECRFQIKKKTIKSTKINPFALQILSLSTTQNT